MIDRRAWLGGVLALGACAPATTRGQLKLGMVADLAGLGDKSYNDAAYAGLLRARARFGARIAVLQSHTSATYAPNMSVFADHAYDEIYCIGYDQADDLLEVAPRYPERWFALIDSVVDLPNVSSVTFKSNEASFLAGALAAMVSRTRTIGFLGGVDIPIIRAFLAGYAAGARAIDPHIDVRAKYVGNFDDVPGGAELSNILFQENADVIFAAAGKAGLGTMQQLRARSGTYAIGVDIDQDDMVPGRVLTSVLKRLDVSVYRLAELAAAHVARPRRLALGLREGGVDLTAFRYTRDIVTPAMRARLARLRAAIVAGTIVVPTVA
jgi:basic membrane protein A